MLDFVNTISIITGAASGLGLGISKEIIKRNGTIILLDIDRDRLNKVSEEMTQSKHEIFSVDVTDFSQIESIFKEVYKKYKQIDYLFNNAGIGGSLPFENATSDHWKKIIDLNIYGVVNGMMAIYPIMKKQKNGYIINTSSIAGLIPFKGQALYNTTKFAVSGLSLTLEQEFKEHNIDISIICPGMVKTRIFYKPIIGEEASEEHVKIPKESISVEEAVNDIMKGLDKKKKIIITPKFLKHFYLKYRICGKIKIKDKNYFEI